ncbi:aminoglycoside phosphotransferase family protein [Legionella bozemanae]|uniref:aminoglycoside phosphotransferase family protein n=1 Tax=Legionella bozemanae TaxID=447 RepID=UPI003EF06FD5
MKVLEKNIIKLYGDKGKQWLASLPSLIKQMEITYGLSELKPVINLSYNYVLSGFQESQPIILKLGLDNAGFKREAASLKSFSGFGVVKVLKESDEMLLIERAVSGASLKSYFPEQDNEAIQITCDCLKRLHQAPIPQTHSFPQIKDWLIALDKDINIPTHYLNKARQLRDDLLRTSAEPALLHGDLHHDNILQNGDGWIVIDPKGVIGEPAFEVAAFIRNPIPELLAQKNAANVISHRIARFAAVLELPEQRILNWCFVQAVLSWVWAIEDGCDEAYFKQLTEFFWKFTDDQP